MAVKVKTEVVGAEHFANHTHPWMYRFPIPRVLHPDYGRMEVRLEPIVKRGVLTSLILSFYQHEIPELEKPFEIPTPQADKHTGITSYHTRMEANGRGVVSFFGEVWQALYCREHKTLALCSYAPDGTVAVSLTLLTSSINIYYETRG
jgi:hypothetical protein